MCGLKIDLFLNNNKVKLLFYTLSNPLFIVSQSYQIENNMVKTPQSKSETKRVLSKYGIKYDVVLKIFKNIYRKFTYGRFLKDFYSKYIKNINNCYVIDTGYIYKTADFRVFLTKNYYFGSSVINCESVFNFYKVIEFRTISCQKIN